jgi:HEAT repeat protein
VAVGEALLAAAQTIGREGEARHVATITKPLSGEGWPGHIRLGAFETQAIATPALAHTALIKALGGDDAKLRDTAAALVAELQKSKTSHYLRALPKLPAGGQAALLKALGMRGDPEAEGALIASLESDTPEVREAAMQALGDLDTPGAIPVLAKLLAPAGTPESAMAREALRVSRAKGADDILSRQLLRSEGELKVQLLELLTDRLASQAVVLGARVLENEQDPALRLAAWRAMAQLGGEKELRVVLAALPEDAQGDESAAAAKALASVAAHHPDAALPLLVEALKGATPQRMPVLMRTLPRIGTPGALEQVLAALNNEDAAVQTEAIAALEDWPSGDALPHLLALAQSEDAARHERGLRGYVRIARTEQDPNKRGELLDAVMPLARKKEEKWAVLAAYGTVMHPRAFDALQAQLGDAEVRNEAGAAITTVARELGKKADFRARAVEALEAVIAHCDQQGVKDRAAQARDTLAAQ